MRLQFLIRLGICINAALALVRLFDWIEAAKQGSFWQADFSMFYTGFAMARDGEGASLYDLDAQLRYHRDIVPERGPEGGLLPFNYPPHTAVPAHLLAFLSRDQAFFAWSAVQVALLLLLVRQLLSWSSQWAPECRLLLIMTVLAFPPLYFTFALGQVSLLILVCLVGAMQAFERRQSLSGAGWLVLASIKPQLVVVPAMAHVAGRRWRTLALAAGLFLVWAGLAAVMLGPRAWLDWIGIVRHSATKAGELGIFPNAMYNFKGLLYGLLGSERLDTVNRVSVVAQILGLLTPLVLWRLDPSPTTDRFKLAFCLQIGLLTNPHFNPADALVFVLPAVLYLLGSPRDRWFPAFVVFLTLCPLLFLLDRAAVDRWGLVVRPFFLLMVAFAVRMGWSLIRGPANRR